jgi:DNA-binding GntR family transcriptional regulator
MGLPISCITHLRPTTIATKERDRDGVAEMQLIRDAIAAHDPEEVERALVYHRHCQVVDVMCELCGLEMN